MKKVERILLSCDDNHLYLQFLPIVSLAWQKILGIKPTLAYVTDKPLEQYAWMKEYCQDIYTFPIDYDLPNGKCRTFAARMIIRYWFRNEICMVSDMDMIPLNNIFQTILEKWSPEKLLVYGYNAYEFGDGDPLQPIRDPNLRKFPSCYTIATGDVWKEIINPLNLSDKDVIKQWYNINYYDHKESVNKENFDDESLVRCLVQKWNPTRERVLGINRNIHHVGFMLDRLDRSNWNVKWENLIKGFYIDAHCPRPMQNYLISMEMIAKYLRIPFVFREIQ
jgi:hypothetical protein